MKHPYLTTRADSTSYYFRRKVPLKLRAFFEKTEIWLSLETPRLNEAITRLPMPPSNSNASSPRRGTRPTRSESTGCRMVCVPRATTSPTPTARPPASPAAPRWPTSRCRGCSSSIARTPSPANGSTASRCLRRTFQPPKANSTRKPGPLLASAWRTRAMTPQSTSPCSGRKWNS
ncbi:DUF6538 domain-containing protein [Burkholderia oklahomensis]|uniref:DUF6538 domain-containing protein n=1 Tax=Burkholderia oklahomensis TaxID=342113 RepID=UPI003451FEBB